MDHSFWDWETCDWCTGEITQLDISLRQSGTFWAENVLALSSNLQVWFSLALQLTQKIQGHRHPSWFLNPPVSFPDVPAFHGDQIVGWVATTLYESRILEFDHRVSRSSDSCRALFGRLPRSAKRSGFAFWYSTCLEEMTDSLSRTMDRLYPLFFQVSVKWCNHYFQAFWFVILTVFVFNLENNFSSCSGGPIQSFTSR